MKHLYTLLIPLLILFSFQGNIKACHQSQFVLDSISFDGTNYTVFTTFCIGAGVGGGDDATTTFAFGIFGSPSIQMVGYSPSSVTSDSTGCTSNASTFSSAPGIPSDTGIVFFPTSAVCPFACVNNLATCGSSYSDCHKIQFTFNELPDSIRLYGSEGNGNVVTGCYQNMLLDFSVLPVLWSHTTAQAIDQQVEIQWGTQQERNNEYFQILRANRSGQWEELGIVEAVGESAVQQSYSFRDPDPFKGFNQYKIVQVDHDGRRAESLVVSLVINTIGPLQWEHFAPTSNQEIFSVSILSEDADHMSLKIFSPKGGEVFKNSFTAQSGSTQFLIDLTAIPPGIYFLRIQGKQGVLSRKFLKL